MRPLSIREPPSDRGVRGPFYRLCLYHSQVRCRWLRSVGIHSIELLTSPDCFRHVLRHCPPSSACQSDPRERKQGANELTFHTAFNSDARVRPPTAVGGTYSQCSIDRNVAGPHTARSAYICHLLRILPGDVKVQYRKNRFQNSDVYT